MTILFESLLFVNSFVRQGCEKKDVNLFID